MRKDDRVSSTGGKKQGRPGQKERACYWLKMQKEMPAPTVKRGRTGGSVIGAEKAG